MKAINFKESNKLLMRPPSMTAEECFALPIFSDGRDCISCWEPNLWERIRLLFTGKIWLGVLSGNTSPPVWVNIGYPFNEEWRKCKHMKKRFLRVGWCALFNIRASWGNCGAGKGCKQFAKKEDT